MANEQSESDPFKRLDDRRRERDRERMELNKRLAVLNQEADEDAIALKVLRKLYPEQPKTPGNVILAHEFDRQRLSELPLAGERPSGSLPRLIPAKQLVLAVLREAYPEGLTAGQIGGRALVKHKRSINPNTLSVSLARHKEDGAIRLEGKTWFYVKDREMIKREQLQILSSSAKEAAE